MSGGGDGSPPTCEHCSSAAVVTLHWIGNTTIGDYCERHAQAVEAENAIAARERFARRWHRPVPCDAVVRADTWPYARRCRATAVSAALVDGQRVSLCAEHAAQANQPGPQRLGDFPLVIARDEGP